MAEVMAEEGVRPFRVAEKVLTPLLWPEAEEEGLVWDAEQNRTGPCFSGFFSKTGEKR
jgi:hypothetical protein